MSIYRKLIIFVWVLCALNFCVLEVLAAPRKHWYKDPKWWIGEAVIAGAIAADAHSTATRPAWAREWNVLLGPNPSNGAVAKWSLVGFGAQTSFHAIEWHFSHHVPLRDSCQDWYGSGHKVTRCTEFDQDRLGWRILGYTAIPAEVAIINGGAAARNYQLEAK